MTRVRSLGVLLCAVLMFTAATGSALAEDGHGDDHHPKGPPPANVAQAELCLHNGWKAYVRADLTPFKSVVACVVYALKGGQLMKPPPLVGADLSLSATAPSTYEVSNAGPLAATVTVHIDIAGCASISSFGAGWNVSANRLRRPPRSRSRPAERCRSLPQWWLAPAALSLTSR